MSKCSICVKKYKKRLHFRRHLKIHNNPLTPDSLLGFNFSSVGPATPGVRLPTPPSHWTRWATSTALTPPPVIPWATTPAKMKGRTRGTPSGMAILTNYDTAWTLAQLLGVPSEKRQSSVEGGRSQSRSSDTSERQHFKQVLEYLGG